MTRSQAKKLKARKIKYGCVFWDWKEEAPVKDLVRLARKYKYALEVDLGCDQYNVFFSNTRLTEKLCNDLYDLDCSRDDEYWEWDEE